MVAGFPPCRTPVLRDRAVGWGGTRGSHPPAAPLLQGFPKQNGCGGGMGTGGCQGALVPWVHAQGGRCLPAPALGRLCLGLSHALGSPGIPQCILTIPAQICDPKFPQ